MQIRANLGLGMKVCFTFLLLTILAWAGILSAVRGVVHDPSHRPIPDVTVTIHARGSAFTQTAQTTIDGSFQFPSIPAGEYTVQVDHGGFAREEQLLVISSGTAPVLHFQLRLAGQTAKVEVNESLEAINSSSVTPTTLISRQEIDKTPGASLSNSLNMITDFVPGAYVTHDQLHVRGGHQVTWAIDGVPIPNTNIASNVGPQIDPKDIDTLEVQRGGYSAEYGDRTYGVFNVVPRTGFERSREMEVTTTLGTFHQTNDQINFGDHTERLAWYGSVNGNRSDYGLGTPGPLVAHDRVWGLGGFGSLIYNASASDQLRWVTSLRRDDYQIPNDRAAIDAGIRDVERERDVLSTFTWVHTISPRLLFTAAPFVHFNRANYDGDPHDSPSATQHLDSTYAGAQFSISAVTEHHNARGGLYGFGQKDTELVHLITNDGSGDEVSAEKPSTGHLEAAFLEDQFKVVSWLTLTGGVRLTHFSGAVSENAANPRVGVALRLPHLNWVFRGFYGRSYQAPPLSTVSGPLLNYAVTQGLGIIPLKGERDEENQVGITIPVKGWIFDVNSFRQRARNFFDHNSIGNSNIFFPLSIAGARIYGQEFTVRSPRLFHRGEASIAYSYQHAEAEGAITGGLTDFSFPDSGYSFLDHDQRHTLHGNFALNLPWQTMVAGGIYYGSGFTDGGAGYPKHLDPHNTFDFSVGKSINEDIFVAVTALNVANRRYLLDNSTTFGGTHYADPRQIYVQVRYRLHF